MRIDDLNRSQQSQALQKATGSSPNRAGADSDSADQPDVAEISLFARAAAGPGPQRLEQLRNEIQTGRYQVSGGAVANGIINDVLEG